MLQEEYAPPVKPLTMFERLGLYIKNHRAYLGILVLMIAILVVVALTLTGCPDKIDVAVPEEWMEDYNHYQQGDSGSSSYSFFANLVRGLTQEPFINYELNELEYNSLDDYVAARNDYLYSGTNISWEDVPHPFEADPDAYWRLQALFQLNPSRGIASYQRFFEACLDEQENYGIKSFSGLRKWDYGPSDSLFSYLFNAPSYFLQDSELLLNMFVPRGDPISRPAYSLVPQNNRRWSNSITLRLNGSHPGFNNERLSLGSSAAPRREVENGNAKLGFYLKYKDVPKKKGYQEVDLDIGKVYMVWSPNLPRRELLWIYNRYIAPSVQNYARNNSFVDPNTHWLPEKYPYEPFEAQDSLAQVAQEKSLLAKMPGNHIKVKILFDHSDMGEFADLISEKSDDKVTLVKDRTVPPEEALAWDNASGPMIYLYGVTLHSIFNLPTEVISRSFWYKASGSELKSDAQEIVDNFGAMINPSGEPNPEEYAQYARLERALSIGPSASSRGGLFPLFTVPYALIYNEAKVSTLSFNTTRGFVELKFAEPNRKAPGGRERRRP